MAQILCVTLVACGQKSPSVRIILQIADSSLRLALKIAKHMVSCGLIKSLTSSLLGICGQANKLWSVLMVKQMQRIPAQNHH